MTTTGARRAASLALLGVFVIGVGLRVVLGGGLQSSEILIPISMYALVGAVIVRHRPRNPIGWVFLGIGGLTGLMSAADVASYAALEAVGSTPWWGVAGAWILAWVWYPLLALMTLFTFLLYPSGLQSARWRPLLWVSVAAATVVVVVGAIAPSLCLGGSASNCAGGQWIPNPLSPAFMAGVDDVESTVVFTVCGLVLVLGLLASVFSAVVRTFRSTPIERLQMRWFAFASALLVADMLLESHLPGGGDGLLGAILFFGALTAIPLSCGVAIMRYRLFEIDRIISRTLAYALVTGVLLAVYAAVVTSVTQLLPGTSNSFSVAAATLAAAALFRPLLSRVQRLVDHRFNRGSYDAHQTVEAFAARLREETDEQAVLAQLEGALDATLQPAAAVIWLRARQG